MELIPFNKIFILVPKDYMSKFTLSIANKKKKYSLKILKLYFFCKEGLKRCQQIFEYALKRIISSLYRNTMVIDKEKQIFLSSANDHKES